MSVCFSEGWKQTYDGKKGAEMSAEIKAGRFDINIWARGGKSASVQECHRGGDTKRERTGEQGRNKEQDNERLNESKRSR